MIQVLYSVTSKIRQLKTFSIKALTPPFFSFPTYLRNKNCNCLRIKTEIKYDALVDRAITEVVLNRTLNNTGNSSDELQKIRFHRKNLKFDRKISVIVR